MKWLAILFCLIALPATAQIIAEPSQAEKQERAIFRKNFTAWSNEQAGKQQEDQKAAAEKNKASEAAWLAAERERIAKGHKGH